MHSELSMGKSYRNDIAYKCQNLSWVVSPFIINTSFSDELSLGAPNNNFYSASKYLKCKSPLFYVFHPIHHRWVIAGSTKHFFNSDIRLEIQSS